MSSESPIEEMVECGFNVDMVNSIMTMTSRLIQEKIVAKRLERELTLVVQLVIQKIGQFNGDDITRFLEVYMYEMAKKGVVGLHTVTQSNRVVTLNVQVKVVEFQEIFHVDWNGFHQALN